MKLIVLDKFNVDAINENFRMIELYLEAIINAIQRP